MNNGPRANGWHCMEIEVAKWGNLGREKSQKYHANNNRLNVLGECLR